MASKLEMKDSDEAYERLQAAVLTYISEIDNPVPDASYRRILRNQLRKIVGAPDEPPPRQR